MNAQLRAAAVAQAQKTALENETGDIVDENAVYMDDDYGIAPRGAPQRTRKRTPPAELDSASGAPVPKKKKYVHKDQYALPVIDGPISKNAKPSDPRLATEAELRSFIDEMRPEDFDMDSEFFSNLPIEVKYEIIGDLRIKSRQANFKRVEAMRNAPTPLDFSKAQILGLSNRNVLTQKLLSVTDSLSRIQPLSGQTGRIAGERNKEYVLIKNDASTGAGYILGVRDTGGGTRASPVKIDATTTEESDADKTTTDEEFEQVDIPKHSPAHHRYSQSPDPELRRELALEAIKQRYSPVKRKVQRGDSPIDDLPALPPQKPLFRGNRADEVASTANQSDAIGGLADFQPDFDLWDALQQSVETAEDSQQRAEEEIELQRALEQSRVEAQLHEMHGSHAEPAVIPRQDEDRIAEDDGDESDVSFDEVETSKQSAVQRKSPPASQSESAEAKNGYESDDSVEYVQAVSSTKQSVAPSEAKEVSVTIPTAKSQVPSIPSTKTAASPSKTMQEDGTATAKQKSAGVPAKKPEGLHIDIPPAAYRPPSPEEKHDSPPDPAVLDRQAERDASPQIVEERDGLIARDYAQQPVSPAADTEKQDHTESPPARPAPTSSGNRKRWPYNRSYRS